MAERLAALVEARPLAPPPTPAEVRRWAAANGMHVASAGRVPAAVVAAYEAVHVQGG